ncbi:N utilization substance protein B [Marinicauda pacifica]|jgi:N utilization substance protein B|uniref:Transcription antitermination protein NusB n=1 Tax=Marinicauda pacifica TaxID=1133559 RepID=A0A4S2HET2_9PROT|nr:MULTISPECIES: transcription antitermination factor NusB [Marinicauda]TGY94574.1 transcription antitermination factor NusB [Marinicauda pacifica]GGE36987.1 N utilization substance protein B [Marinicauda pacifica]
MSEEASDKRARLRRSARLAAVQALYQMELAGAGASEVTREFLSHRFGHDDEPGDYLAADEAFFEDLLSGVVKAQDRVDETIRSTLKTGWKLSRLDSTLRAILRAGGYELLERSDVPVGVVINEYVDIAHAFYEGSEPGFINASLESFARRVRPEAFN